MNQAEHINPTHFPLLLESGKGIAQEEARQRQKTEEKSYNSNASFHPTVRSRSQGVVPSHRGPGDSDGVHVEVQAGVLRAVGLEVIDDAAGHGLPVGAHLQPVPPHHDALARAVEGEHGVPQPRPGRRVEVVQLLLARIGAARVDEDGDLVPPRDAPARRGQVQVSGQDVLAVVIRYGQDAHLALHQGKGLAEQPAHLVGHGQCARVLLDHVTIAALAAEARHIHVAAGAGVVGGAQVAPQSRVAVATVAGVIGERLGPPRLPAPGFLPGRRVIRPDVAHGLEHLGHVGAAVAGRAQDADRLEVEEAAARKELMHLF